MDLTGQKFGRLLVLGMLRKNGREYCKCECSCEAHSIVEVWVYSLLNGDTKSCGCYNLEKLRERRKDLSGQVFGRWKVLEYVGNNKYRCECSCDNHTISNIDANSLRQGTSTSCGCIKHEKKIQRLNSFIGQKFGEYTIESIWDYDSHKPYANAVCNNGHSRKIRVDQFSALGNCLECQREQKELEKITHPKKKYRDVHIGDKFGKLEVINVFTRDNRTVCTCRCGCGNEIEILKGNIYGRKSCGKCRKTNLVGQTFGRWQVISFDSASNKWRCMCSCDKHTIRYISTSELNSGHTRSCGCFAKEYHSESNRKDLTNQQFGKLTVMEYDPDTRTGGRVYWRCKCECGNITSVSSSNLVHGHVHSCGKCMHGNSMKEIELRNYIKQLVPGAKIDKVKILDGKEIDIYLAEYNLGIEYNGSAYHASLGGIYDNKSKDYHQQKFLLAKEKGIHLINIFDVDFEQNRDKILAYLKDLLIPCERLPIWDCEIRKIENNLVYDFVNKYCLLGADKANLQINYGLYYNNELYAIMSFKNIRNKQSLAGQYELHRYCVKSGYTIIGGVEKIFELFIQDYNPHLVKGYSDNDYFSGQIYIQLGFEEKGQIAPCYYWLYKNESLKQKYYMLKQLQIDYPDLYKEAIENKVSNKEDYIMLKLGAKKIYRSGNTLWEWHK